MKMRTHFVALVLFVITLASCSKESLENTSITEAENATDVELELLAVVNDHRISLGQSALDFSEVAYEYANQHNDYMISIGSINHDNFSSRASKISSQASAEFVAENVAKDYTNAAEAFQGWLNSSSHKKTMEGDFSHTAVSVKINDSGDYYFTQIFFRQGN
ncbi:CAP domain-containing protein [Maribacter algarum]|uniref:CAP domain-containing protein n=1 Tax=Maribacter algarum (ex Zhang et al. 2020) TaxID=2578118 RepID=A0A5S3PY48_9FLAO|nr:CAP domain-containing protein [Maribacter algarum]TMM59192.1 CAP domain-containing protein [Maribacter algarum]